MKQYHQNRPVLAFTLVELLTVIAIIALLAGLIVGMAGVGTRKARIARVSGEREQLVTAIENYKAKLNYYPPDNTNSTIYNPLFYELTGTLQLSSASGNIFISTAQESLNTNAVTQIFNQGGFDNSSPSTNQAFNLFQPSAQQVASFNLETNWNGSGTLEPVNFSLLVVPLPGPALVNPISGVGVNPWHYSSSNPQHNQGDFDLWMDITIAGKTNRISNWSTDPQVVNDFQR